MNVIILPASAKEKQYKENRKNTWIWTINRCFFGDDVARVSDKGGTKEEEWGIVFGFDRAI